MDSPELEGSVQIDRAPVGFWTRRGTPGFWTYTYEDLEHSVTSLAMFQITSQGMTRITRCDGSGDEWFFGEGANWNEGTTTRESSFTIYKGNDTFGIALETLHGTKSITFRNTNDDEYLGSAVKVENSGYTHDFWSFQVSDTVNIQSLPPYYVMNAATVLMAFRWNSFSGDTSGSTPVDLMSPCRVAAFLALLLL